MSKIVILFYLISLIFSKGPYKIENDVLVLTEKTFGYALKEYKYITVLFYDPECPHCQDFMPTYHKIATLLKEDNFIFGKLNCIKYEKLETIYEIEGYPTLMLIKGEEKIIYDGYRKYEDIKKWLEEKTKPEFFKLKSKTELDNFTKNRLSLVYFGNNESTINELIIAERKFETMPLGIVSNEDLIKSEATKDEKEYINIYTTFDDKKNTLKGTLSSKNIYKFIYTYSYPKVIEFSDKTAPIIFSKRNPSFVVFSSKNRDDYNSNLDLLREMWPNIQDKIRLFVCDIGNIVAFQMAQYCGVDMTNIPRACILEAESDSTKKYEMKEAINKENIIKFIKEWEEGKLTPYIRSEPVPENNNGDVIKLVGTTFKKEVLENDKDVLVYFKSYWCKKCEEFEPELIKLAKKLKKNKILIATMDATLNDVDELQIHNFPTILFYPGNAKDEEPLEMKGRKNSIQSIEKFILKHAYNKISEPEKEVKEEIDQEL